MFSNVVYSITDMIYEMSPMYATSLLLKVGIAQRPGDDDESFQKLSDALTKALKKVASGSDRLEIASIFIGTTIVG